mgnify:CR=1 FL=1
MTKEQFTTMYYPLAKKAGDRFGMNPEIILAQAALESGWGSSYGAREQGRHAVDFYTAIKTAYTLA